MPTEHTVTRELVCKLSDAELRERGDAMAEAELHCDRLKAERKRLNAAIREQTDRRAALAGVIDARSETREVVCEWQPDYRRKRWQLVRLDDNSKLPEEREMSAADLQERLPEVEPDVKAGPKTRTRRKAS